MPNMAAGYRRYFSGLKKADCLLVAKTRNPDFMRLIVEPPMPRRRPDLTTFIHKPLEVSMYVQLCEPVDLENQSNHM
jgi:hypothetical protein